MGVVKGIFSGVFKLLKSPIVSGPIAIGFAYLGYEYIVAPRRGQQRYIIGDQEGKTYIVTGATSGLGEQLAKELANKNATVIMACRNKHKCLEARRDIVLKTRNKKVFCRMCDLSDPSSVHSFVQKISTDGSDFNKIDGVVLNAATKCKKYDTNVDGVEMTLATNHMGSFLLVGLLLQKLLEQAEPSKILFVGTDISTKDNLKLDLDALNEAKYDLKLFKSSTEVLDPVNGKYDIHGAYKFSKLMQLVFARELAERLKATNKISVVVADPGGTKTKLNRAEPSQNFFLTRWSTNVFGYLAGTRRKPEFGVGPILYALCDPDVPTGVYINPRRKEMGWGANAEDVGLRQKVWLMSERWTRLAEHMQKMEEELEKPRYFEHDPDRPNTDKSKSAKYLWLV